MKSPNLDHVDKRVLRAVECLLASGDHDVRVNRVAVYAGLSPPECKVTLRRLLESGLVSVACAGVKLNGRFYAKAA